MTWQQQALFPRRAGLAGQRSGLFWEIARLIDEFAEQGAAPEWLILENVPGLLSSHGGRDMGTVIGALVDRGYRLAWRVLDAQHFGVAQRRRRVFIVGRAGGRPGAEQVLLEPESGVGDPGPRAASGPEPARAVADGAGGGGEGVVGTLQANSGRFQADAAAAGHFVAGSLQAHHPRNDADSAGANHFIPVTFVKAKRAQTDEDFETWREDEVTPTLNQFDTGDSRATTLSVFGMNGYASWVEALTGTQGFDASEDGTGRGNPIVFHATQNPISSSSSSTAPAQSANAYLGVCDEWGVRRLTPLEHERLQGFPDNWTVKRHDLKKDAVVEQSDSARYRQMGNAVAVPVVEWIARRLMGASA